jgi:ABC-2 type transport system permease protein
MTGVVFTETLRRHWRQALFWGLGLGFLIFVQVAALPSVDALQQMTELLDTMPPVMLQMFGMGDTAYFATPEGYIATRSFGLLLLLVSIYAIAAGLNVTANDEERGIMDSVLSLPIARWQLVLEKLLAYMLMSVLVVVVILVLTLVGIALTPSFAVDTGKIVLGSINVLPGMWLMLAFTAFAGALMRRKGLATALAVIFLVGSYFIDTLGRDATTSILNSLRVVSFHSYYDAIGVIRNGFNVGNVVLLLVVAIMLIALSLFSYERRDIGV